MSGTDFAIYALTRQGAELAKNICGLTNWTNGKIFLYSDLNQAKTHCCSSHVTWNTGNTGDMGHIGGMTPGDAKPEYFERISEILAINFNNFPCHILICASGIAVRSIAPLIRGKTVDPAVLLLDQKGKFVISLLSGHLGGANRLANELARDLTYAGTCSEAVITTATDIQGVPAIDLLALENNLHIVNPTAIRKINSALLKKAESEMEEPLLYDQKNLLKLQGTSAEDFFHIISSQEEIIQAEFAGKPMVLVNPPVNHHKNHQTANISATAASCSSETTLILASIKLWMGLGCKKGITAQELREFIFEELFKKKYTCSALLGIASIDLKKDEPGIKDLAASLNLPLIFFSAAELSAVKVKNPSSMVKAITGSASVCEAAALLASDRYPNIYAAEFSLKPTLVLPKRKSKNITIALASA